MANQQVKYTITGENLLSKVLKQVDVDAQKAENSVNKVTQSGKGGSGGSGGMLGSIVGGNLIANGISRISGSLVGFGKDIVDSLTNYQYFSTSLKTMMHGDAEMSKALENQLVSLAKTTPFSLLDVQQGTKQLMAYGFAGSEIVGTMKMLGDVSAGVGKPLNEVAYLYGTLKTQGRAFSKDINQFTTAGIPIVKQLAKQFGVTEDSVMKLVEKGKVGFKEVEQAFKGMTAEGSIFFNLMDEQSRTVGGQISAMGDTWEQIKVNIGKSQTGIISGTVNFVNEMATLLNKRLTGGNFLDESLKKHGLQKEYENTKSSFMGGINFGAKAGEYKDVVTSGSGSYKDISQNLQYFGDILKRNKEKVMAGDITIDEYKVSTALIMDSIESLKGGLKLLGSKEEKIGGVNLNEEKAKKEKADRLGTGVTIEAQVPKNQYITINGGLVHEMKIESMDGSTPVAQIKEQISTTLVELLNDAYQAMR